MEERARADVYHLHLAVRVGLHQYVLRLEVAVDYVQPVEGREGSEDLPSDHLQLPQGEVLRPCPIGLIEVLLEELSEDHEVLAMVEVVVHGNQAGIVSVAIVPHIAQQLDLVQGLVHVVLIVEDDLQAVALLLIASSEVLHLDRLAELGLSQNAHNLEPASQHLVDHYRHLPLLLEASLLPIVDHLQLVAGVHDSI